MKTIFLAGRRLSQNIPRSGKSSCMIHWEDTAHRYLLLLLVAVCTFFPTFRVNAKEHRGQELLKPETCETISPHQMGKLPPGWRKYLGYIKACSILKSRAQEITLISIWIQDYFNSRYPKDVAPSMENFPLPIIVDQVFKVLGTLPEYYPDDPPRELDLYYLLKQGSPPDLYVKVHNPGAGGDYSYPPMRWN